MTGRTRAVLIATLLSVTAIGCGGAPTVEESPTAVPGMDGEVDPSIGVGASEQPDNSSATEQ